MYSGPAKFLNSAKQKITPALDEAQQLQKVFAHTFIFERNVFLLDSVSINFILEILHFYHRARVLPNDTKCIILGAN